MSQISNKNLNILNVETLNYTGNIYYNGVTQQSFRIDSGIAHGNMLQLNNLAIGSECIYYNTYNLDVSGTIRMRGDLDISGEEINIDGEVVVNNKFTFSADSATFDGTAYINSDLSANNISCVDISCTKISCNSLYAENFIGDISGAVGTFNNIDVTDLSVNELHFENTKYIFGGEQSVTMASKTDISGLEQDATASESKNWDDISGISGEVYENRVAYDASWNDLIGQLNVEIARAKVAESKNWNDIGDISGEVHANSEAYNTSWNSLSGRLSVFTNQTKSNSNKVDLNNITDDVNGKIQTYNANWTAISSDVDTHISSSVAYDPGDINALQEYNTDVVTSDALFTSNITSIYAWDANQINLKSLATALESTLATFAQNWLIFHDKSSVQTKYNAIVASNSAQQTKINGYLSSLSSPTLTGDYVAADKVHIAQSVVLGMDDYALFVQNVPSGIGSNYPYASGTMGFTMTWSGFTYVPSLPGYTSGKPGTIYASEFIWSDYGFLASSDRRIKENITDVSDNVALQQLRDIPCRFYEYKDKAAKGGDKIIGFIAQEVREHMPMAVTLETNIIPNEMRVIDSPQWSTDSGKHKLTISDLDNSGTTLYRFYVGDDTSEVKKEIMSSIDDPKSFIFDASYSNVFIYGKSVDDFHSIDKQKIFALNFSATQEIDKIQQISVAKIKALETENAELKSILNSMKTRLSAS